MELHELNPHIRYAHMHTNFRTPSTVSSISYDCRLFYFEQGSGSITVCNKSYVFTDHTAIYLPPCSQYYFILDANEPCKLMVFNFDLICDYAHLDTSLGTATPENFDSSRVPKYLPHPLLAEPITKQAPHLASSLRTCCETFLTMPPFFRETASARIKLCLIHLMNEHQLSPSYTSLTSDTLAYIRDHFSEISLTNSMIASNFGYSAAHLNRKLKSETGMAIHAHLTAHRLKIAKNYLLTTDYTITEISWKTGFASTSYFVKAFRLKFGVSPNIYRKSHITSTI